MQALVTGSSGLLGGCLTALLRARGDRLRLLDVVPLPAGGGDGGAPGAEFVQADLRDLGAVEAAARGVDVIYHLAAAQRMKPQFRGLSEDAIYDMNVRATAHVLEAAERCGVRKVVYISSSGIYGLPRRVPCAEDHPAEPLGAYGRSKLVAEGLCREALARGLDVTALRPMSLFGPGMTGVFVMLFEWVRTGRPVYMLGRGRNRVQMASAWDVAEACTRAVDTPASRGEFLNIGAVPDAVPTVHDQVRALIAHAGSSSRIVHLPAAALRTAARLLDTVGLSPIVPEHYLLADRTFILDIGRLERVLGWRPPHGNVELMTAAYDWYVRAGERPAPHPILRLLDRVALARARPG